jgi:NAD(P)-dependent dehydrogenase (short-subunit alcohol dehydrogenase family)
MTLQPDLLAGEVVVVTSGMARIAVVLGRLGARVLATGPGADAFRVPEGVDVAAEELDVPNKPGMQEVINGVERLDILVNCAGVIRRGEEHRVDVFEKVLAVNLTGTMRMCSAAPAKLKESNGCITNTASMLSFFGGGWVCSPSPVPGRLQSPCVGQNPYYYTTDGRPTSVGDLRQNRGRSPRRGWPYLMRRRQ